jgi:hypothetical protein
MASAVESTHKSERMRFIPGLPNAPPEAANDIFSLTDVLLAEQFKVRVLGFLRSGWCCSLLRTETTGVTHAGFDFKQFINEVRSNIFSALSCN